MDYFVIQVDIPADKCPKVRGRKYLIKQGRAKLLLSNNTSIRRSLQGFTRYGVSSGRNVIVLTCHEFKYRESEITDFLDKRFENNWGLKLIPIQII
ncbi:hypothetical protein HX132_12645 [Acinetobacter sp. 226-4]|nr:hypothetical protein [Acinetobacter sp. 226-1]MDM1768594.1 hypothetical protein [Acinetobacter sp. 226-4]